MVDTLGDEHGGPIGGSGGVPAMLTGGEFVMSPEAVEKHGPGFMSSINTGSFSGFAEGGLVGETSHAGGGSKNEINITVNISGEGGAETVEANAGSNSKEFANKIKSAVLEVIQEQKRVGGSLR